MPTKENELVGDTTHYYAFSSFETLTFKNEKGKEKKKSRSKVTKSCHCDNKEKCQHPWKLTDDGAGTIVKAHKKYIWGHKASILGLPLQGIPLDAIAVADAAIFDGERFLPHVKSLFEHLPEVQPWIDRVLYDSACDSKPLKNILPHIDTQEPPMSKRFKAIMIRRPSVKRMIKRLKCDLSADRSPKFLIFNFKPRHGWATKYV